MTARGAGTVLVTLLAGRCHNCTCCILTCVLPATPEARHSVVFHRYLFTVTSSLTGLTTCACVGLTAPTFLYCYVGCSVIFITYFYIRRTSVRCICVQTFSSPIRSPTDLLRNQFVTCKGRGLTICRKWIFCEIFDYETLLTTTIAVVASCITQTAMCVVTPIFPCQSSSLKHASRGFNFFNYSELNCALLLLTIVFVSTE